jgi:hypothetical protein
MLARIAVSIPSDSLSSRIAPDRYQQ